MSRADRRDVSKPQTTRVRFTGAEGYISHEIGVAAGASPQLEPGAVYELPAALAARLLASSTLFEPAKGARDA